MRTANPALNEKRFRQVAAPGAEVMTIMGTVHKTAVLLFATMAAAAYSWHSFAQGTMNPGRVVMIGSIAGLAAALVCIFKPATSPFTAPAYAVFEGLALGAISALFNAAYPGIVMQAVLLTLGTLLALLVAYRSGLIQASENFRLGVFAATGGIAVFYLMAFALGLFGIEVPLIHSNSIGGIVFSGVVVVVAALNLVLDFDFIEQGSYAGAPKYMEWYGAFGLLVTLVWLYLEILRLLAKLQSRR